MSGKTEELVQRVLSCLRDCYLNSDPAVDISKPLPPKSVDPDAHVIKMDKFKELLQKHSVSIDDSIYLFINKFPKIVD